MFDNFFLITPTTLSANCKPLQLYEKSFLIDLTFEKLLIILIIRFSKFTLLKLSNVIITTSSLVQQTILDNNLICNIIEMINK